MLTVLLPSEYSSRPGELSSAAQFSRIAFIRHFWRTRPTKISPTARIPATCGDPGRTRTCDTRFRKPVLYPLSYGADGI